MPYTTKIHPDNPFGRWTKHRATIAQLGRTNANDPASELDARRLLKASRLADALLDARDDLTDEQRQRIAAIILG